VYCPGGAGVVEVLICFRVFVVGSLALNLRLAVVVDVDEPLGNVEVLGL
jgi:hypothetical protein